jgi:hypothetical protein
MYGISNNSTFEVPEGTPWNEALNILKKKADFGLTWDGFWLKSKGTNGYVSISSERDFEVIRKGEEGGQDVPIIQIGRFGTNENEYGFRINNTSGEPVMEANKDGELWLKNVLQVETKDTKSVKIGKLGHQDASHVNVEKIIDANGVFKVFADGHVIGTSAHFYGGSTFQGEITATGGTIGGLTIDQWSEVGYRVEIVSSEGVVIKTGRTQAEDREITLTANLYKGATKINGDILYEITEANSSNY